jgi:FtsP/CotA-like multicopper oxidase with cupredoxin domain
VSLACIGVLLCFTGGPAFAQTYVPGGTLDPTTIPKYVTPLVIPPQMPKSTASPAPAADYDIAVRQFQQQILPGGIWGASFPSPAGGGATVGPFPATTVWSYGRAEDPAPDSSGIGGAAGVAPAQNSSFNYPAFTVENTSKAATTVRWINGLVDGSGNYLPQLFPVDQTVHWANPPNSNCAMGDPNRTDCESTVPTPYTGPVPIVTHVHGAHVQPHSDGYPEAWWLPAANNIPAGYAVQGSNYGQADNTNTVPGSAYFSYENTQPAATIWYHDHALGMTRLNVYAGPAGFWLIRGGSHDTAAGVLPGPAPTLAGGDPNFNATVRAAIREVPIAIQDRSFNTDGSLFYPQDRTFFDGFTGPFIGGTGTPAGPSDIHGIWNPEAFFNTMVVNGTTWPKFDVAPARYRLRLLNGCNSRTLNLSLFVVSSDPDGIPGNADDVLGAEVPIYQLGGDQGFLPKVVKIVTGFVTTLPGDGTIPAAAAAADPRQALLLMPAERGDVIVDFSGLADGTRLRMINTAPDAPFGGFPAAPFLPGDVADALTSGQVMDFVLNSALTQPGDATCLLPENIVLPALPAIGATTNTRQLSLNELSSSQVCVEIDAVDGHIVGTLFSTFAGDPNFLNNCAAAAPTIPGNLPEPMGPQMALLGVVTTDGVGNVIALPKRWGDAVTEAPLLNSTEVWEIFNTTADAHPVHLHQVGFQVIEREDLDPGALALGNLVPTGVTYPSLPNEKGYKDTVISYPGQIVRIKANFDIAGLYVWHCHIIEHEDHEMMRPLFVNGDSLIYAANTGAGISQWNLGVWSQITANDPLLMTAAGTAAYAAFGTGVWTWNGTAWSQITPSVPEAMTASGAALYGDFGAGGIWNWDGTTWNQVTASNPEVIAAAGTFLYGDFGTGGIWKWDGATWNQVTASNPETMAAAGTFLYGDFGTGGIWKWDGTTWNQVTASNPETMAASGSVLYGDFGTGGIWKWDGTAWSQISADNAQTLVASGSLLYADFGGTGVWKWDGATWSQLTTTDPALLASAF